MALNINKTLTRLLSDRLGRSATRLELAPRLRLLGSALPQLTAEEKSSISNIWGETGKGVLNYDYWRFYKAMNPDISSLHEFVPDNIYWSRIIRALNPASLTRTYINKSLYPIIFKGLKQPDILINVIDGVIYSGDMERLSADEAVKALRDYGHDIIIKPTTATSGGSGVTRLKAGSSTDDIKKTLSSFGKKFICQGVVRQSSHTAAFNDSSLNTFRVNTLNINGKTSCELMMMRHGLNGNFIDNFAAGGVVCGMRKDGSFNGNNFNVRLQRITQLHDGTPYSSLSVPGVDRVIETAINAHRRFMPHIGHAAWDFALDEDGIPVMIEVNLMLPGILMEQLTAGNSIFGNRTREVIDLAITRNKSIAWTEFVGGWE